MYSSPAASAPASARFWSERLCAYQFPASTTSAPSRRKTGIMSAARTTTWPRSPRVRLASRRLMSRPRREVPGRVVRGRRSVRAAELLDPHLGRPSDRDRPGVQDRDERERLLHAHAHRVADHCRSGREVDADLDVLLELLRRRVARRLLQRRVGAYGILGRRPPSARSRSRGGWPRSSRRRRGRTRGCPR